MVQRLVVYYGLLLSHVSIVDLPSLVHRPISSFSVLHAEKLGMGLLCGTHTHALGWLVYQARHFLALVLPTRSTSAWNGLARQTMGWFNSS